METVMVLNGLIKICNRLPQQIVALKTDDCACAMLH